MKARFISVAASAMLLVTLGQAVEEQSNADGSRAIFDALYGRLRDFDEIRLLRATVLVDEQDPDQPGKTIQVVKSNVLLKTIVNVSHSESFFELLEPDTNARISAHGCRGLFNVEFYRQGELVGVLHYAHGRYWGALLSTCWTRITDWLVSRGVPVDELLREEAEREAARKQAGADWRRENREPPVHLRRKPANPESSVSAEPNTGLRLNQPVSKSGEY